MPFSNPENLWEQYPKVGDVVPVMDGDMLIFNLMTNNHYSKKTDLSLL